MTAFFRTYFVTILGPCIVMKADADLRPGSVNLYVSMVAEVILILPVGTGQKSTVKCVQVLKTPILA